MRGLIKDRPGLFSNWARRNPHMVAHMLYKRIVGDVLSRRLELATAVVQAITDNENAG
jgi:hypothetical protein